MHIRNALQTTEIHTTEAAAAVFGSKPPRLAFFDTRGPDDHWLFEDLVAAVQDAASTDHEVVATLRHMIESGSVVAGRSLPIEVSPPRRLHA